MVSVAPSMEGACLQYSEEISARNVLSSEIDAVDSLNVESGICGLQLGILSNRSHVIYGDSITKERQCFSNELAI